MSELNPHALKLARHALGLPNDRRRSYRNKFVTGPGGANETWTALVDQGLAKVERQPKGFGGADYFWLTEAGARAALQPRESLCPEDFPTSAGED